MARAILNEEWANPVIDWKIISFRLTIGRERHTSSVLYMLIATPGALKSKTFNAVGAEPSAGVYTSWSFPGPGTT